MRGCPRWWRIASCRSTWRADRYRVRAYRATVRSGFGVVRVRWARDAAAESCACPACSSATLRRGADCPDLGPDPRRSATGRIDDRDPPPGERPSVVRRLGIAAADRRPCVGEDGFLGQGVVPPPATADSDLPGGAVD